MQDKDRRNNPPKRGPMGMGMEKPKNLSTAIGKLVDSIKIYKKQILISIILAGLSAVLALASPNRLSTLTDEISKGLIINTESSSKLTEDILSTLNKEKLSETINNILNINSTTNYRELSISELTYSLEDSTYNDIYISNC